MSAAKFDSGTREGRHQEASARIVTRHLENLLGWQEDALAAAVSGVHEDKWRPHGAAVTVLPRLRHG